jgi:GNAT superfamily N-acetyltransferase
MKISAYKEDRSLLLPLFAMADDSSAQIATYLSLGEILVTRDGDLIIGHLQIIATGNRGIFEIKNMAVTEKRQREGIGRGLIATAMAHCIARRGHRLIVSTAAADIGILRFYQRLGFRMDKVVRDAFTPSKGYPEDAVIDGIPLRDQVFLDLDLSGAAELQ